MRSDLGDDEAEETEIGKDEENGSGMKNSMTGICLEGERSIKIEKNEKTCGRLCIQETQ
jgi:hypothetical protein